MVYLKLGASGRLLTLAYQYYAIGFGELSLFFEKVLIKNLLLKISNLFA